METEEIQSKHTKLDMVSYGFNSFSRELLRIAFSMFAFFFYEAELGLNVWLIGLSFVLFSLYNMVNDPFIGYITNRPFKFTKKWGRRFPWIVIGGLPWGFTYMLIFMPPTYNAETGAWTLFFWLLFTTCLFDTFHSLMFVNFQSLFPDKYRSVQERRTASGIYIMIGVVGVAIGAIVPPLIFDYGNFPSFGIQGIVIAIITFIGFIVAIPGSREDQATIDLYLSSQEGEREKSSFFKTLIIALKQKPFIMFMVLYTLYQSLVEIMQASVAYTVKYSFGMPGTATTFIFAAFLVGVLVSTPFWTKYSHKVKNNKKVMIISAIVLATFTLPITFLRDYWLTVLDMFLWGLGMGGFWVMIFPVSSDVIDNAVVITKRREEGVYTGFQQFFGRIGIIVMAITFATVHTLTGFVEGSPTQTELAIWGVHIHQSLIPFILLVIGIIVFWLKYDLTPEKVSENQKKIEELGL